MIDYRKKFLCVALLLCFFVQTSCGSSKVSQDASGTTADDSTNIVQENSTENDITQTPEENGIFLHRGDWLTSAGIVDQTWTKDYDNTEWENTPCLYLYIHFPDSDNLDFSILEDELNHRLHMTGYDFHVQFLLSPYEEYFRVEQTTIMERREEELGISIDLYMSNDYLSAVQNQEILDLSDYLAEQEDLYGHYDKSVWEQLRDSEGRIYGIPANPIAAGKLGYAYNPQLASKLSIDMTNFTGDPATLESYFPAMLEEGIKPLCLFLMPEDYLMLSLAGLETYGDIFAVRHDGKNWEVIDLLQEEEMTNFYIQLGEWMEKGYLCYSDIILSQFDQAETPMNFGQYRYRFLQLQNQDIISWAYDVNMADEGGFLETDFFILDQPAYIYEKMNSNIMVVSAQTDYPEECMEFLRLLALDEDIRLLLYSGIEGHNYMWENNIQIFDSANGAFSAGLALENDLRFWPVAHFSDMYTRQIEELNANVRMSVSLQHPFDPAGMEERYEACKQLFEENILVFLGYYGAETAARLTELHEKLIDAGYLELIDAINAER